MHFFPRRRFWAQTAILFVASTGPVYAYLDPGSGSYVLQLLLGGAAGLAVISKLYWNHFLAFLGSLRSSDCKKKNKPNNGSCNGK